MNQSLAALKLTYCIFMWHLGAKVKFKPVAFSFDNFVKYYIPLPS